jgi:hypothetical protein
VKYWEIIADNLKKAGFTVGWVPSMEPFTAALLVTSRVTPQSAAQTSKPKVYRRVLVVFFSSLTIVVALTLNLANTGKQRNHPRPKPIWRAGSRS